jgi:hypothetical protein
MVERKQTDFEPILAFEGDLRGLEIEESEYEGQQIRQLHMQIEPTDAKTKEILKDTKTGMIHNFINISDKTTDEVVIEGSNLEKYLIEIETVLPAAKKAKTYMQAFELLKGKNIRYVYKKLGKAYKQYEGKSYHVPQSVNE